MIEDADMRLDKYKSGGMATTGSLKRILFNWWRIEIEELCMHETTTMDGVGLERPLGTVAND